MTLQNPTNVKTYTGNGVTTVFPYDFLIPGDTTTDQSNVEVTLLTIATGVEGAPLADNLWSITGVGEDTFGNVTYTGGGTPLPSTHKINIRRVVPYEQTLDLTIQSAYFPELLEETLDLIVMQIQQLAEESERAVKVTIGTGDDPQDLIDGVINALADTQAAAAAAALSETNAAASAVAADASADAAAASVASIGTSVSDAAASAAAAAASEAAADASEAAAEAAEIAAAGSASSAATDASTASTAATNAANSASAAATDADDAEAARIAAEAAKTAAEAAAGGLTDVQTQINAAADTAFAEADMLTARKAADGSLIKRSWENVKTAIATLVATLHPLLSLLTTRGDMIYRDATTWARLPKGNSGEVLTMGANDPAWATPASGVDAYGAVGSYCFAGANNGGGGGNDTAANSTRAGSSLTPAGASASTGVAGGFSGSTLSGTWRAMGYYYGSANSGFSQPITLWIRTV